MVIVEVFRSIKDAGPTDPTLAVRVIADGDRIRVEGPEKDLIDVDQAVINLRDGTTITRSENAEDWVRGLAVSFRTPYLSARIVEDTEPITAVDIERSDVRERIYR